MSLTAIDKGSDRDILACLDALVRTEGWGYMEARLKDRIDRTMQRIVQPDCSDKERAELAGEVRGLAFAAAFPKAEAKALLERSEN